MLSPAILVMPDVTVCTTRSARSLDAGWYGAEATWTIPFFLMKVSNSSLVKCHLYAIGMCHTSALFSPGLGPFQASIHNCLIPGYARCNCCITS